MRYRLLLSVALFISIRLFAQQDPTPIQSSTTIPPTARFEIIQSTLAGRWLFKLDRQTGIVYQMVHAKEADDLYWEQMSVLDLPLPAVSGVHYQLFLSGLAAKFTLLMNLDTGKTWQLQHSDDPVTKEEVYSWKPI